MKKPQAVTAIEGLPGVLGNKGTWPISTGEQGNKGKISRPVPIVLVKCWKVAHWNAKKLLKNCQKSKKLLPKFQKLLPKFLAIFI